MSKVYRITCARCSIDPGDANDKENNQYIKYIDNSYNVVDRSYI